MLYNFTINAYLFGLVCAVCQLPKSNHIVDCVGALQTRNYAFVFAL